MDHFTHGRPRLRQQAVRGPRGGPAVDGASLLAGLPWNAETEKCYNLLPSLAFDVPKFISYPWNPRLLYLVYLLHVSLVKYIWALVNDYID